MEAATCAKHAGAHTYERREPETTLLYQTVQTHWRQFLADIEAEGGELPAFVRDEFEAYLRCGILAHGFVNVRCKAAGTAAWWGFRASDADSARAAWAAGWPTLPPSVWSTCFRKSPFASSCSRFRCG
jgi:hypothetical protein